MTRHVALAIAIPSLLFAGCFSSTAEEDTAAIDGALEKENGGLTMEDEAPAFGAEEDFAELDMLEDDPAHEDAMETDPEVVSMMSAPDAVRYRIAVVWGQIPGDRSNEDAREWSGVLRTNRGAVLVRRTLRFDGRFDGVLPRRDRTAVAFTSVTRPHHDGLALTIVDPTPESDAPLTLQYVSDLPGPLGAEGGAVAIPIADLLEGPVELGEDEHGNRMVAVAHARPFDACGRGFLVGKWNQVDEDRGRFIGRVVGERGALLGHVRGIHGVRESGEQVFFGKYIRIDGTFRGIFRGEFDEGAFRGRWVNRAGDVGALGGRYREARRVEGGGHFLGRWTETSCSPRL